MNDYFKSKVPEIPIDVGKPLKNKSWKHIA